MNWRIRLISVLIIFSATLLLGRLYFVQIVHGKSFVSSAERQYVNKNTISYDRGEIYFQSKTGEKIPAAISRSGFSVSINPSVMTEEEKIFEKADKNEEIAKRLNSETADKIKNLNLYGVSVSTDKWRFYPGNDLASQSIGFVAFLENALAGRYGLERYYEEVLKRDPSKAYDNFFST